MPSHPNSKISNEKSERAVHGTSVIKRAHQSIYAGAQSAKGTKDQYLRSANYIKPLPNERVYDKRIIPIVAKDTTQPLMDKSGPAVRDMSKPDYSGSYKAPVQQQTQRGVIQPLSTTKGAHELHMGDTFHVASKSI